MLRLIGVERVQRLAVRRKHVHAAYPAHLFLGHRHLGPAADATHGAGFEIQRADAVALWREWWLVFQDEQVPVVRCEGVWLVISWQIVGTRRDFTRRIGHDDTRLLAPDRLPGVVASSWSEGNAATVGGKR